MKNTAKEYLYKEYQNLSEFMANEISIKSKEKEFLDQVLTKLKGIIGEKKFAEYTFNSAIPNYENWKKELDEKCGDNIVKLSQELEKLEKEPYEKLEKKALEKVKNIKKATLELVEKKSWYHVLHFIEKKENLLVSQALRGWEQTIQKIGKGTGKNAPLYRKQAKEKMATCQKAVPAWIMPMNKVIDTLNPAENKFDIIIIDEASQSDLSSLILLYMAKKVIIVGDDKQVSPLDVGKSIDKIKNICSYARSCSFLYFFVSSH